MAKTLTTGNVQFEGTQRLPVDANGNVTGLPVVVNYAALDENGKVVTRTRETVDVWDTLSATAKSNVQTLYNTITSALKAQYE